MVSIHLLSLQPPEPAVPGANSAEPEFLPSFRPWDPRAHMLMGWGYKGLGGPASSRPGWPLLSVWDLPAQHLTCRMVLPPTCHLMGSASSPSTGRGRKKGVTGNGRGRMMLQSELKKKKINISAPRSEIPAGWWGYKARECQCHVRTQHRTWRHTGQCPLDPDRSRALAFSLSGFSPFQEAQCAVTPVGNGRECPLGSLQLPS